MPVAGERTAPAEVHDDFIREGQHPPVRERSDSAEVLHTFTRKGRTLPVRVREVSGVGGHGHLFVFGEPRDGALVRIHSQCLYGEAMGSDSCDCGPELELALDLIYHERGGVLIYLEQEGRGSGLMAKAQGYAYSQTHRTDTFESYERLGFPHDARVYDSAIDGLRALGFLRSVQLMTNNPRKVHALREAGFRVERVRLYTKPRGAQAAGYLSAKRRHREFGHGLWSPTVWDWLTAAKRLLLTLVGLGAAALVWALLTIWPIDGHAAAVALATVACALLVSLLCHLWSRTGPLSSWAVAVWDEHRAAERLVLAPVRGWRAWMRLAWPWRAHRRDGH
ncbi:GTP cyclohydrolase II [Nocardia sp. NPDC050406]|uniref:GTP cyclohydrolase II n=1 Tax=Nocardia sp. NPDC050406 TaxID=3364318 RepID=UPI0037BB85E7